MGAQDAQEHKLSPVVPFNAGRAERQGLLEEWHMCSQSNDTPVRPRRYEFDDRVVSAEVFHPGGGHANVEVMLVNISSGGCCLIHRGYFHPSTECAVTLETNNGITNTIRAKVQWCRFLRGVYHTAGLMWDAPIEPREYVDPRVWLELSQIDSPQSKEPLKGTFMLLTTDTMQQMLVKMLLRDSEASLVTIDSSGAALDAVRSGGFDTVLIDTDNSEIDALSLPARLQGEGYIGPVIALTHESGATNIDMLRQHGYTESLIKPLSQDSFVMGLNMALEHGANAATGTGPILSTLTGNEDTESWIEEYLKVVRESAKTLEEAARADDTVVARRICDSIRDSGTSYGFPLLTEYAASALTAVNASGSANEALSSIRQLIRIVERLSLPLSAPPPDEDPLV